MPLIQKDQKQALQSLVEQQAARFLHYGFTSIKRDDGQPIPG